ncbi:MAG TPA: glycosyltransferase, partial [Bacteroidales bacterium]|nr:glycosyltransferase [Bacteroidales bacterium]
MSIFLIITFIVFCISTSVQLFYYLYLFPSIIFKPEKQSISTNDEPVSIIIAAKNEAENLEKNLPKILNQNFNEFEIIIVLDQCTDNSLEILEKFQAENKNLKILKTQTPNIGKKHA